jgi:TP901 family phage tail tape measure protein
MPISGAGARAGFSAGDAYVSVKPKLDQFGSELTKQIQPQLDQAGKSISDSLSKKFAEAGKSIEATGAKISAAGSRINQSISVPLIAAGVAAGRVAFQFDDAMTQISAVTNTSAADLADMREQVLQLSGETARGPVELAESMYFLASAGLEAAQQQDVLERSAKASAAGLGNTADIARLSANALNAYADSGLTAAQVTDTLVAAVREGTAEPSEFADALGAILPIASAAGVSFDEVTASLAALSNIGLDVNEGVTAMRGLLGALEAPGTQAADTLAQLGISADEMRRILAEDGLLAALQLLEERSGGNIDVLQDLIPNIRALTGFLGVTGQEAEKVSTIFGNVRDATGSLNEAFRETGEGDAFKFRQAMADAQVAMLDLGETALPVGTKLLAALTPVFDVLSRIPPELLLVVAGLGPVVSIVGKLVQVGGLAVKTIGNMTGAFTLLAAHPVVAVLATLGAGIGLIANEAAKAKQDVSEWVAEVLSGEKSFADLEHQLGLTTQTGNLFTDTARSWGEALGFVPTAEEKVELATALLLRQVRLLRVEASGLPGALTPAREEMIRGEIAAGDFAGAVELLTKWTEEARAALIAEGDATLNIEAIRAANADAARDGASATQSLAQAHRESAQAIRDEFLAGLLLQDGFLGIAGASLAVEDAHFRLGDAQQRVNELVEDGKKGTKEYREAINDLKQAQLAGVSAEQAQTQAVLEYISARTEAGATDQEVIQGVRDLAAEFGLSKKATQALIQTTREKIDAARDDTNAEQDRRFAMEQSRLKAIATKQRIDDYAAGIRDIPAKAETIIGVPGVDAATSKVNDFKGALAGIDRDILVHIGVDVDPIKFAQHGFHGSIDETTLFVAHAGERVDISPAQELSRSMSGAMDLGSLQRDLVSVGAATSVPFEVQRAPLAGNIIFNESKDPRQQLRDLAWEARKRGW